MPPGRRQSASRPHAQPPPTNVPLTRPLSIPPSKLKIHPLLEVYEATISALIGTLSEDPFRPEAIHDHARRLLKCEEELEDALEEGTFFVYIAHEVKQHLLNADKIQRLQRENTELTKLLHTNLTQLSEARNLLASLPESFPATIDSTPFSHLPNADKIPYQQILEYASKLSKFTSPPPQWDPTRPQQPGPLPPAPNARLISGTYVPWPSEDIMRRGRLGQLAAQGLPVPPQTVEEPPERPRRNPRRRASSVEARRRKLSEGGEPRPIQREREIDFGLDLFKPEEE
jgi:Vitamin-D-receptor interacting Mediator subunit 4